MVYTYVNKLAGNRSNLGGHSHTTGGGKSHLKTWKA